MSSFPDDPSLEPLRIDRKPFRSVNTEALYHWQASRPPSWRRLWPDDPLTMEVLERVARLLRYRCGWRSDAFVPGDKLGIVFFNWEKDSDPDELIMEMEDLFDVQLPDAANVFSKTTLDEVVRRIADKPPDFAAIDRDAFAPFSLPADYQRTGLLHRLVRWLPFYGGDRHHILDLRERQARRSRKWREYWPADGRTQRARALVSRVLVDRIGWFDEAFIPDDRMDALLLAKGGAGRTMTAVDELVHLLPGRIPEPESLPASKITLGGFIEKLV